jgi:hypothetical protein
VIKEGKETIIYDKVAYREKAVQEKPQIQNDKIELILTEIKTLKNSINRL